MASMPGFEPGPLWREASPLTTAPSLLPKVLRPCKPRQISLCMVYLFMSISLCIFHQIIAFQAKSSYISRIVFIATTTSELSATTITIGNEKISKIKTLKGSTFLGRFLCPHRPIRLTQCCTQFKPFGNKTFCFRNFHII